MYVRSTADAPLRQRQGMTTRILLEAGDAAGADMAVTWVEVGPGARQGEHRHTPQQVYVVVAGQGRMHVADETRDLTAGDLAYVPPDAPHYIVNTGSEALQYISAATPTFSQTGFYAIPLQELT